MTMRNLARGSAAGLLAAGVLALAATPALAAADVDFGLELKGSSIALGAAGKPATVNVTNHGKTTPDYVGVTFDVTKLDSSKVEIDLGACTVEEGIADCQLDEDSVPAPGATTETDVPLVLKEGASDDGPADLGKLTVTVSVEGDANPDNNSKTVDVKITGSGGDLRVLAFDVTKADDEGQLTGKPLSPGESSYAWAYVANHGDRATKGLKLDIKLPEHVTFAEEEGGCVYAADKASAVCTADDAVLTPWDSDDTENKENSSGNIAFKVSVSEDAEGPVTLAGGKWTVSALGLAPQDLRKARTVGGDLPEFFGKGCKDDEDQVETDATDNSDDFVAQVAGPTGGTGGGDGPGLPVTGPVAATVAGVGGAVLVIGAALFMVSRRRRVVLVTPGDGK